MSLSKPKSGSLLYVLNAGQIPAVRFRPYGNRRSGRKWQRWLYGENEYVECVATNYEECLGRETRFIVGITRNGRTSYFEADRLCLSTRAKASGAKGAQQDARTLEDAFGTEKRKRRLRILERAREDIETTGLMDISTEEE